MHYHSLPGHRHRRSSSPTTSYHPQLHPRSCRLRYPLQLSHPVFSHRVTRRQSWACPFLHCVIALPLLWHSPRLVSVPSCREERERMLSGPGPGLRQVSMPQNHSSCKSQTHTLECGVLRWKAGGVGSAMVESLLGSQGHHPKAAPIGNFAAESQPCQPYALPNLPRKKSPRCYPLHCRFHRLHCGAHILCAH